jgi:hypothetical protein
LGIFTVNATISGFIKSAANNHTFVWNSHNVFYPGLDAKHFSNRAFQQYFEELTTKKLRMRNFFVGTSNQFYYSVFKKSFAENSHVIIGKNNQLFEILYILSYCRLSNLNHDQSDLLVWADKIKKLSDYFEKQSKTFIYLITPSKVEYMPNAIPDRFPCLREGISMHVKQIVRLLEERGVRYING